MRLFDQVILALAIASVVVCLLAPLVIVAFVTTASGALQTSHSLQTTVGIGVIFRATARRLIQTGARGAIRAASSTVMRAFTRTFTRRFARVAIGLSMGAAGKRARDRGGETSGGETSGGETSGGETSGESGGNDKIGDGAETRQSSTFALVAGVVVLGGSFIGATYAVNDATRSAFYGDFQFSHAALFVLSSFPVLVYAGLFWLAGAWWSKSVRCTTQFDGLLLQGYFAGAGSFLPMATDFLVDEGASGGGNRGKSDRGKSDRGKSDRGKSDSAKSDSAKIASFAIGGLYAVHLVLLAADQQLQLPVLRFCSAVFLIYAFVNAFPIDPLGGHYVWQRSKLAWLALFGPILVSFFFSFPDSLAGLV